VKHRSLRIAFSVTCAIACLLFIVLWVRTTYICETIFGPISSSSSLVITSRQGGLGIGITNSAAPAWRYDTRPPDVVPSRTYVKLLGAAYSSPPGEGVFLRVLYPVVVPGVVIIAIVPWINWTGRFSLRTLLLATTLLAFGLGLIVSLR
jgi:hypothetical protein